MTKSCPRMITVRLKKDEHEAITRDAHARGLSVNTFILQKLGFDVADSLKRGLPRGRRSSVLSQPQPTTATTTPPEPTDVTTDLDQSATDDRSTAPADGPGDSPGDTAHDRSDHMAGG